MPDYKNGKIYSIRSYQTEQIYIGSTTQSLSERISQHKKISNTKNCTSKIILQYEDAYIELIELFPCNSKEELNKKEGEHIRANNCVNKVIPCRTKKEYEKDNQEYIKEQHKKQHQKNRIHRREQQKQYYEKNKEQIREKHREYRQKKKTL